MSQNLVLIQLAVLIMAVSMNTSIISNKVVDIICYATVANHDEAFKLG